MKQAYLNLFKAIPVSRRTNSLSTKYLDQGVLIEDSVLETYNKAEITELIQGLVPTDSQINKTFHKSWKKVCDASMLQLIVEQITHYLTTYGAEHHGIYDKDNIYIPYEDLKLEAQGGITFYILRGITCLELSKKVNRIIVSGVALSDQDLTSLVQVIKHQKLAVTPSVSANKELATRLYELLGMTPADPVEYLRLQIYNVTDSSLLIKSPEVIEVLSTVKHNVFKDYEKQYGLKGLASIFYRFKPLFLALKNKKSATTVNRISKLAKYYHTPMPEDTIGSVTKNLRNNTFDINKLNNSLENTNVFRKIKLIQALKFYSDKDISGVMYSIRNGKSFATTTTPLNNTHQALTATWYSLYTDLQHLKDKKIYMDTGLVAPTSGKMFMGDVPFGSCFCTDESLAIGVSWKDLVGQQIDLDLSIVSVSGKTGWDACFRDQNFLFSGDITAAPNGATEAHLVRQNAQDGIYLLMLNYYNSLYGADVDVPFTLFVTQENEFKRMNKKAVMNQDNMVFWANSSISKKHKQKIIGVLKIVDGVKIFHAFEFKVGKNITSNVDKKSVNTINYYSKYLDTLINLRTLFKHAGAILVQTPEEADIDLSLKTLTKEKLISVLQSDQ